MIPKEVKGVALGIMVLVGVFGVSYILFPNTSAEPFSAVALLGQQKMFGEYPTNVTAGQPFTLYMLVSNHEGGVQFYSLLAKLATPASVNDTLPLNATVLATFDRVVPNDENYTWQGNFQVNNPGQYRLVFELWTYDSALGALQYDGRFVQLWINVTAAATTPD